MATITTSRDIPLQNLPRSRFTPSLISRTSTDLPPNYSSVVLPDYASTTSTSSTINRSLIPSTPFISTSTLQITTPGKAAISFPLPVKELEIPIYSPESEIPKYISIRPIRRSGSCFLTSPQDVYFPNEGAPAESSSSSSETESENTKKHLADTKYKFGLHHPPVITISPNEAEEDSFEIVRESMFSRSTKFESRKWGLFEWRYAGKKERPEGVDNLLVLERLSPPFFTDADSASGSEMDMSKGKERKRVAQLVRGEGSRTEGSKRSAAGNGGRLEMCLREEGVEKGGEIIDEVTVVVTCLVMLKKEIDRLRAIQIAVITSGGGGC